MTSAEVEETVNSALEAVLRRKLRRGDNLRRADTAEWDSLRHVELVFAIESSLGIQFGADELAELDSSQTLAVRALRHLGSS